MASFSVSGLVPISAAIAGSEVAITVESPAGMRRTVSLPVSHLGRADLGYTFALPFSIGVLYLLLGGVIFVTKRDLATALTLALCLVADVLHFALGLVDQRPRLGRQIVEHQVGVHDSLPRSRQSFNRPGVPC